MLPLRAPVMEDGFIGFAGPTQSQTGQKVLSWFELFN
jgi:hypothetical protein